VSHIVSRAVIHSAKLPSWMLLLAALYAAGALSLATVHEARAQDGPDAPAADSSSQLHLPVMSSMIWQQPICRIGLNVARAPVSQFNLSQLRIGWYIDYKAHVTAPHPNGAAYAPVINLEQVGESDYTSNPSGSALDSAIADNLGADWIIGNEPDRRYYQNDMSPAAYAHAYHDLYYYIKSKDSTARIFAGAIVQPTPLRLQYLDKVLQRYQERYGEDLPADGWAIHNFILNERSCAKYSDPAICWGADIPPGIEATDGLIITTDELQKTADVAFFKEQVVRFRQWMADHGYRNRPLYVSEYGILMPESYGFPPSLVNNYMTKTFDFLLTATDDRLGYAADGNRLVQRLAWYSTIDPAFNGSLFQSTTSDPLTPPFVLTSMGDNFRAYADAIAVKSEFKLLGVTQATTAGAVGSDEGATLTFMAEVANGGNNQWPLPATVRFYLGDPAAGGVELGSTNVQVPGCGRTSMAEFVWTDVPASAGGQYVYARLQANGVDMQARVQVVTTEKLLGLPLVWRPWQLRK
jgi:hypothetical protein